MKWEKRAWQRVVKEAIGFWVQGKTNGMKNNLNRMRMTYIISKSENKL